MAISYTFDRGIHPHDSKELTAGNPAKKAHIPRRVVVPLSQHIGAPAKADVSVGDEVKAQVDEITRNATIRNHSATHLLHAALRENLGDHVKQAGSLVAPDRLRFDFSHFTQVSTEKLAEVERVVNEHIRENLPLHTTEMSKEEAMKTGDLWLVDASYHYTIIKLPFYEKEDIAELPYKYQYPIYKRLTPEI